MLDYRGRFYDSYRSTCPQGQQHGSQVDLQAKSATWQRILGRFLPVNKDAHILDAGCGDGRLLWWLQRLGYENAEGVDISAEQLELARGYGVRNTVQGDLRTYLSARSRFYDLIILRDVLEHFAKVEVVPVLEACRDALVGDGRLVLQVPNSESPFFGRIRYGDFTHETAFCCSSLSQVLSLVGLDVMEFGPVSPPYGGLRTVPRLVLWKAVESLYTLLLSAELGPGRRIVTQSMMAVAVKPMER